MDIFGSKKKQLEQQRADEVFRDKIKRAKAGEEIEFDFFSREVELRANLLGIGHELAEARVQLRLTRSFKRDSAKVSGAYARVQVELESGALDDAIPAFVNFDRRWNSLEPENQTRMQNLLQTDLEQVRKELVRAVNEQYRQLCVTAMTSAEDLRKLKRLVYMTRIHRTVDLSYLPNWNELVIKLIDSPSFDDFLNIPEFNGNNQAWADKAAQALIEKDVPTSKIIIATCDQADPKFIRRELSNLISDLHKMVAQQRQRNRNVDELMGK